MQDLRKNFDWEEVKQRLSELTSTSSTSMSEGEINAVLAERAARFRREENNVSEDSEEMIIFTQSDTQYAIPLRSLTEIRPVTRLTPLPMVSRSILGVINVRGRIVAIYSLVPDGTAQRVVEKCSALIGHGVAANVAILADDVIGTAQVRASEIRSAPISLGDRDYITGVGSDGLVYLDLEKLVNNRKLYMA